VLHASILDEPGTRLHRVVTGGPRSTDTRLVDVLWEGQALAMFAEDVQKRGEEVTTKATSE